MPFVKRHIRRRLASAKESCDKELKKVVGLITAYFEERLRKEATEFELDDPPDFRPSRRAHRDDVSEDGGDETDHETGRRSRKSMSIILIFLIRVIFSSHLVPFFSLTMSLHEGWNPSAVVFRRSSVD